MVIPSALSRAGEGDEAAFARLVVEHERMVYGIALHSLHDRETAEELSQEVFLQLYRSLDAIESPEHLVNWLRRVTANRCIDVARRRRFRLVPLEDVAVAGDAGEWRDPIAARTLARLIGRLPARQRLVIVLRYQEELELGEIAATLSMSVNTVKSHLRRGIEKLRRWLGESAERSDS